MKKTKFIYAILCMGLIWSCAKDFVVKDIKNQTVSIIAPANSLVTANNAVTFWWNEVDGAEKYNIQIVKPSFTAIQQLITDTNVTGDKFRYTLSPGTYQWRIKAKNAGGSTQYTTYDLTIDTTSDLSAQLVVSALPVNNSITGKKTIGFSWNSLSSASSYQVLILNSVSSIVKDTSTTNTTFTTSLSSGGVYTWKVRALNGFSISQYNSPQTFTVDLTAPSVSILSSPANGSSVKDTTSLKWTRTTTDTWVDSVYVSADSLFSSVFAVKSYSTSVKISSIGIPVNSTYYWWRLRSVDSVGNRSGYSTQLKFKLIP